MDSSDTIWLIGCGQMAVEYSKILNELNVKYYVIGRGEESAVTFENKTKVPVIRGGVKSNLEQIRAPKTAIIATGVSELSEACKDCLNAGVSLLLVEKPGALNIEELNELNQISNKKGKKVFIAYNRRFFASVAKAKELIRKDGGTTSFNFEVTEWWHKIVDLPKSNLVLENWFIANSTHVTDLAFYLGGNPKEIVCNTAGSLKKHSRAKVFSGCGITQNNALFTYSGNWGAPGSWAVEVLTEKHRYILKPLEKLQIQKLGSVKTEYIDLEDDIDKKFKPGLLNQTKAFISGESDELCTLSSQLKLMKIYQKMAGYNPQKQFIGNPK
jgi:predicted dehydrogenase